MSVRTIERWLATGGEPEHHRPSAQCRDAQTLEWRNSLPIYVPPDNEYYVGGCNRLFDT